MYKSTFHILPPIRYPPPITHHPSPITHHSSPQVHKRARIAHAALPHVLDLTALRISHESGPLLGSLCSAVSLPQCLQRAHEHANRVPPADSVLSALQVLLEGTVVEGFDQPHALMIHVVNRLVNRRCERGGS
ncbi:hypothetical protein BC936DRAFT_138208 [Jimgerdemannia flammicorona]|uniref:Uncharacterized protein n=1 Tax=Jimgerdemannia flammicorona TaxID=994334 RepID=A0A433CVM5_9FUNG|nr:hypothetical protein BC936DRAFT_138208 [Jimgerdemannia flammicorona]